jgi:hypothetical protein
VKDEIHLAFDVGEVGGHWMQGGRFEFDFEGWTLAAGMSTECLVMAPV